MVCSFERRSWIELGGAFCRNDHNVVFTGAAANTDNKFVSTLSNGAEIGFRSAPQFHPMICQFVDGQNNSAGINSKLGVGDSKPAEFVGNRWPRIHFDVVDNPVDSIAGAGGHCIH